MIEITFNYEPKDFIRAWRLYRSSVGLTRLNRIFAGVLLLVGTGIFLYYGLKWYVLLIFIASIEAWFDLAGEINWRTYYFRQHTETQQYLHVLIDNLGITLRGQTQEVKGNWSDYKGLIEGKTLFLLVIDRGKFSIFPKRAFRDEVQLSRFRDFVREKLAVQ